MTDRTHPDSGRATGGIVEMLHARIAELEAQPAPSAAAAVPGGWTDADADAARLALELECLLMDTKDAAVVSKWWASANAALEMHRTRLKDTPQADSQPAPDEIINMAREQGLPETEIEGVFRVNADDLCRVAAAILAARAPADSVLEDAGGANWQDISTAPKDGTRFVAVGNNYGLYSEGQHTCIAQWFRGCWIDVSEWNETSELKYLTHWMPLPPLPPSTQLVSKEVRNAG